MAKSKYFYYGLVLFTGIAWAATYSVISDLVKSADPYVISFLRSFLSVIFFLFVIVIKKKPLLKSDLVKNLWPIFGMSLAGILGYYVLAGIGLKFVDAGKSALITSINPALVVLLSALIFKEPLGKKRIIGTIVSFMGVLIVVIANNEGLLKGLTFYPHDLYFFATGMCVTFYVIFNRFLGDNIDYSIGLFWCYTIGTMMLVPWSAPYLREILTYNIRQWLEILFLGVICGAVCNLLWYQAMMKLGAGTCGLINSFIPLFAVLLAWAFLGEKITSILLIGAFLLIFGVWIGVNTNNVTEDTVEPIPNEFKQEKKLNTL